MKKANKINKKRKPLTHAGLLGISGGEDGHGSQDAGNGKGNDQQTEPACGLTNYCFCFTRYIVP